MKKTAFRFKKRYVLIVLIGLLVVLTASFFVFQGFRTGKLKFKADTSSTITNIATVTYQDASGNTYTVNSNPVEVQIVTAGTVSLTANPTSITSGGSSTLTWTIADFTTDQCSATPLGWWSNSLTGTATVSPTATSDYVLTCQEGTNAPVSQTATVTVGGAPVDSVQITLTLDGKTNSAASNVSLKVYQGTNLVFEKTDITTDTAGAATITVTGLTADQTYDFLLKPQYFLAKKVNKVYTNGTTVPFGSLYTGDINNNNQTDPQDLSMLLSSYRKVLGDAGYNPIADLVQDNQVGPQDLSKLLNYYHKNGDSI